MTRLYICIEGCDFPLLMENWLRIRPDTHLYLRGRYIDAMTLDILYILRLGLLGEHTEISTTCESAHTTSIIDLIQSLPNGKSSNAEQLFDRLSIQSTWLHVHVL